MVRAIGINGQVAMGFETTFNSVPASPTGILLPFISSEVKGSQNLTDSKVIRKNRNPAPPIAGNRSVGGALTIPIDAVNFGYILKAMFGTPTTTGSATPYTHIYKIGSSMPSFWMEQGFTDIGSYSLYTGCMINKLSMSFGGDGELEGKCDVLGCKETLLKAPTVSSPTSEEYIEFANFSGTILEGGSTIATVTSLDLNFDYGLDGDSYTIGNNGYRRDIVPGIANITGTLNALFEDTSLLTKSVNNTETSIDFKLTNGTNILEWSLPEVLYEQNTPGISGPKGISISLPFRAYYGNGTDKSAVVVTLTNSKATY